MNPDRNLSGTALVYIVDDDRLLRDAIASLLRSVGIKNEGYESWLEFLRRPRLDVASCLLLDVWLQGVNGLKFQAELNRLGATLPIIFMTGHGDIPMSVRAMKAGAVDFLTKPFRDQDRLDAVNLALKTDEAKHQRDQSLSGLRERSRAIVVGSIPLHHQRPAIAGVERLELLESLHNNSNTIPFILLTAFAELPVRKRAMQAGASRVLSKSFDAQDVMSCICQACD